MLKSQPSVCIDTAHLTPCRTSTAQLIALWLPWGTSIRLATLYPSLLERRSSYNACGTRKEIGTTHNCQKICSAHDSPGRLNWTENQQGDVEDSFLAARSHVAPKKQQSILRLELCAALTGAQMAKVITTKLTLPIRSLTLWSDSLTVLTWLLRPLQGVHRLLSGRDPGADRICNMGLCAIKGQPSWRRHSICLQDMLGWNEPNCTI